MIEELSELQKEVCKDLRGHGNQKHIIEEMADVLIMIEQLKIMKDISNEDIQNVIDFKTKRLIDRMNEYEQDHWLCECEERNIKT